MDIDSPYYNLDSMLISMVGSKSVPGDGFETLAPAGIPPLAPAVSRSWESWTMWWRSWWRPVRPQTPPEHHLTMVLSLLCSDYKKVQGQHPVCRLLALPPTPRDWAVSCRLVAQACLRCHQPWALVHPESQHSSVEDVGHQLHQPRLTLNR